MTYQQKSNGWIFFGVESLYYCELGAHAKFHNPRKPILEEKHVTRKRRKKKNNLQNSEHYVRLQ